MPARAQAQRQLTSDPLKTSSEAYICTIDDLCERKWNGGGHGRVLKLVSLNLNYSNLFGPGNMYVNLPLPLLIRDPRFRQHDLVLYRAVAVKSVNYTSKFCIDYTLANGTMGFAFKGDETGDPACVMFWQEQEST